MTRAPDTDEPGRVDRQIEEYLRLLDSTGIDHSDRLRGELEPAEQHEFDRMLAVLPRVIGSFPNPLQPQRRIADDIELVEEIGAGGYGKVWKAKDLRVPGRLVAVKFVDPVATGDVRAQDMLLREARALAEVGHHGVVDVHRTGQIGDTRYLVMELVEGRSLDQILDALREAEAAPTPSMLADAIGRPCPAGHIDLLDGAASWAVAVMRITVAILRVMEAVHAKGIVHRDLKPSNVMLGGGGHPVILDFGMAGLRDHEGLHVTQGFLGTIAYLAPEQINSARTGKDPRTDVYQIGLLLYELLTRRFAYTDQVHLHAGRFPAMPEGQVEIPTALEEVCLRALAPHPDARYQSVGEFREDLERVLRNRAPRQVSRGDGELGSIEERFDILEKLHEDARVVRLRAQHRRARYEVIIEMPGTGVRALRARSKATRERALFEAQALGKVQHENIVELRELVDLPGDVAVVLKPWAGEPLEQILAREGALDVELALHIGLSIARAADAIHQNELIHRGIEPANVWFDLPTQKVVLGGFTFAKPLALQNSINTFARGRQSSTRSDTSNTSLEDECARALPLYLAPEQLQGTTETPRSDIYGLGCTLFRMLTGQCPARDFDVRFGIPTVRQLRRKPRLRNLSDVVERCMAPQARARYATMVDVVAALEACRRRRGWLGLFPASR
ncbi:MAG: protein kinase [Planctomycetes bacterium]|nr:protein kinase [Planctomycetota bacterium]